MTSSTTTHNPSRLLVYGGTFDPPHRAHVDLSERVRAEMGFDRLIFTPSMQSPHKADAPLASFEDRVAMLEASIAEHAASDVSCVERDLIGDRETVYGIDMLRGVAAANPGASLRLLIGADQALAFHRWRAFDEIIALAPPVVMLRAPAPTSDALRDALRPHWSEGELARWLSWIAPVPVMDVDATSLRDALVERGPDDPEIVAAIPAGALRVIREHGLYEAV